ncbi:MAG: DUF805 domain-containing protein [Oscillospiraceae bacterium]
MNEYIDILMKYVSGTLEYKGRTGRSLFWKTFLCIFVLSAALGLLCGTLHILVGWVPLLGGLARTALNLIGELGALVLWVPMIALGWRRMHDVGRDGWLFLIPVANLAFAVTAGEPDNRFGPQVPENER